MQNASIAKWATTIRLSPKKFAALFKSIIIDRMYGNTVTVCPRAAPGRGAGEPLLAEAEATTPLLAVARRHVLLQHPVRLEGQTKLDSCELPSFSLWRPARLESQFNRGG